MIVTVSWLERGHLVCRYFSREMDARMFMVGLRDSGRAFGWLDRRWR